MQKRKTKTMQNLLQRTKATSIQSSACVADCYVCGKGLTDGYSVTAKSLPSGIVMFCDLHYSLQ